MSGSAHADDTPGTPATSPGEPAPTTTRQEAIPTVNTPPPSSETAAEYGVGVRLRSVWVPKAILELFVDRAADGAQNFGLGVDLVRRRGTTELQLGFEFEHVAVGEGVWINKGDNVANGDTADYVLSPGKSGSNLGWFTIEFTFINHAEINKQFSVRYGGGAGLGIVTGDLYHYNVVCSGATNAMPQPGCTPQVLGGQGQLDPTEKCTPNPKDPTQCAYGLPPVFPVVNAIIGVQYRPTPKATINIEGGIRTLPFVGIDGAYFF